MSFDFFVSPQPARPRPVPADAGRVRLDLGESASDEAVQVRNTLAGRETLQSIADLAPEQEREQFDGPAPIGDEPVHAPQSVLVAG